MVPMNRFVKCFHLSQLVSSSYKETLCNDIVIIIPNVQLQQPQLTLTVASSWQRRVMHTTHWPIAVLESGAV